MCKGLLVIFMVENNVYSDIDPDGPERVKTRANFHALPLRPASTWPRLRCIGSKCVPPLNRSVSRCRTIAGALISPGGDLY